MAFGEIAQNPEGTTYIDRAALRAAGVHVPLRSGIAGQSAVGAESIVVSGGYEDDRDHGDLIIYTGAGGRSKGGSEVVDQTFRAQNLALLKSAIDAIERRRGALDAFDMRSEAAAAQ